MLTQRPRPSVGAVYAFLVRDNQPRFTSWRTSKHLQWLLEGPDSWNTRRKQNSFKPDLAGANIYEAFRAAGKLDSEDHIPLDGINFTNADLSDAVLCDPFSTGRANLRRSQFPLANLRGANLANSRLEGADLRGVPLDRANLRGAKLRNARMGSASLNGADLWKADLTEADLRYAILRAADISCTRLTDANLAEANLTGANLGWSEPWKATLYDQSKAECESSTAPNHSVCIESIEHLLDACRSLRACGPETVLYFRGEHANSWDLRPSVMRQSGDGEVGFRSRESEMLRDLMSRRPADFKSTSSAFAEWVRAQHHGLKTRLLDVTRNPLVALFYACEGENTGDQPEPARLHYFSLPRDLVKPFNSDAISVVANFAKMPRMYQDLLMGKRPSPDYPNAQNYRYAMNRLYELIRQEKPYFKERIDPRDFFRVFVVEPQQSFERIRVQSGAFLISAFHERFERSDILSVNSGTPIYGYHTWEVPSERKEGILDELRMLNITREALFPSLDEAARAVNDAYS